MAYTSEYAKKELSKNGVRSKTKTNTRGGKTKTKVVEKKAKTGSKYAEDTAKTRKVYKSVTKPTGKDSGESKTRSVEKSKSSYGGKVKKTSVVANKGTKFESPVKGKTKMSPKAQRTASHKAKMTALKTSLNK